MKICMCISVFNMSLFIILLIYLVCCVLKYSNFNWIYFFFFFEMGNIVVYLIIWGKLVLVNVYILISYYMKYM